MEDKGYCKKVIRALIDLRDLTGLDTKLSTPSESQSFVLQCQISDILEETPSTEYTTSKFRIINKG